MSRKKKSADLISTLWGRYYNNPERNEQRAYEQFYTRQLCEWAMSRFKWTGLPDSVDARFIELELLRNALCIFYFDEEYDRFMALRGTGASAPNMYDNPTRFIVNGNQFVNKTLSGTNCVPIWGNALRVPEWDLITLQASKLAHIERTIEINLLHLRRPLVMAVPDSERLSFANMWRQVEEGMPVILGTDALQNMGDKLQVFGPGIDKDLVPRLQDAKHRIWNETMTFLGIDNANQEKRERMVADEVSANREQVNSARLVNMQPRELACDLINKKYGLNVSCEWNNAETSPVLDNLSPSMETNTQEVKINGDVY